MIKYLFSFIALLFISSAVNSQKIDYTNNKLYKLPSNRYNIVGEINGNFVVWKTDLNKHLLSQLFIYDSEMKLIRTIYTNILSSDADPNYQFFITANSILIAYQYKTNDALLYRLANFDENGGLKSVETLDSINVNDKNISNKTLFYKFLQSENSKVICFTKMIFDSVYHVLKFYCSYSDKDNGAAKNFVIPFDDAHENLADIIVDDNKNILVLKQENSGALMNLNLIKKNFSDDNILKSGKTLSAGTSLTTSAHITQKTNGYIVYGDVVRTQNDSNQTRLTGLYVWQTDGLLNDAPGDTTINKASSKNTITYTGYIAADKKFSNVFASWDFFSANGKLGFYEEVISTSRSIAPQNDLQISYPLPMPDYSGYTTPGGIYLYQGYWRAPETFSNYAPSNSGRTVVMQQNPFQRIGLLNIDSSNQILWTNDFADSLDNILKSDFEDTKVIAGNKAIHILYQVGVKKRSTLNHITVYPNGHFTKNFITAWNTKYDYYLSDCIFTGKGELIIPAVKESRIKFAKIKLE